MLVELSNENINPKVIFIDYAFVEDYPYFKVI